MNSIDASGTAFSTRVLLRGFPKPRQKRRTIGLAPSRYDLPIVGRVHFPIAQVLASSLNLPPTCPSRVSRS